MCANFSIFRGLIIAVLVSLPISALGDFSSGVAAFKSGDYELAMVEFSQLATAGDARAQFAVGLLYDNGQGTAESPEQASHWYTLAAEQGYPKAQFNLALMLESGRLGDAQKAEAAALFRAAARGGNPDAVARLHQAAAQGDSASASLLGRMYLIGHAVEKDPVLAEGWLRRAIEGDQPDAAAWFALGVMAERGIGRARSFPDAATAYSAAVEGGHLAAHYNLARLMRLGHGGPADINRATALYKVAAEQGLVEAQLALAMLYEGGHDWPRDVAKAVRWYREAARNGNADARINLAWLYAEGVGVRQDLTAAYALYEMAKSHPSAKSNLTQLRQRMSEQEIENAQQWRTTWLKKQELASTER